MATMTRLVSWSGDDADEHIVSPNLSKAPSVVSVESILSDIPETSPSDHGAHRMTESQPTRTASQAIEPSGARTSTSTTIYPRTDLPNQDGSFMRHNKYFFRDGNVTFLVRNVQPSK